MTTTRLRSGVVPALLVRDMEETLAFYRKLGFRRTGCYPDEEAPTWAEVRRDAVVFQFHTDAPRGTPSEPACSGTFYVYPESVSTLAAELRDRVPFAWGAGGHGLLRSWERRASKA